MRPAYCRPVLLLVFLLALVIVSPAAEVLVGKVVGVTDGDTLTLLVEKSQYKIRLEGIDAPESRQPFGSKAKQVLSEKVFDRSVEVESRGQDRYGRILGVAKIDGRVINTELVAEGWAWHYKQYSNSVVLAKAEEKAREAKLGLWADAKPIAPWDWRRNEKEIRMQPTTDRAAEKQTPEKQAADDPPSVPDGTKAYWLTSSSEVRHNKSCRYYKNSSGRACGPNDGRACNICGG